MPNKNVDFSEFSIHNKRHDVTKFGGWLHII